ncbi:PIN domain-containing protein [Aetokthonos hydrillicola Thurmond2011]|uniref:PIN domain-containing protein n=1 Tax=Aetokthonos hydrillicola Thurmond2011 TaxID=2712845 RepID=A0AAP5MDM1_9CYAN|nr:PIN domain-containing protein [Aetokthonos hydrillicola]MBO3461032.1 PIN domain-containing protein [Aetokthonos hydrillicola CCALA 1050]MBW4588398.1 PIN domain-containing protein [Aetokthonos hydrillicola CCALA 1050]MDR9900767.1 PIN domain-containing protein [Aetokthonos hydrillicola Thurmond2011]
MNARVLLDTNILVYIYDSFDPVKQERAITIVDKLIQTNRAVISTQIMGEFFIATTRAKRQLLEISEASDRVRNYMNASHVVEVTQLIILEAIRGVEVHNFPYWDAQIWATARLNQISEVYSEDFNVGATIEGVKFTNPLC